MEKSIYRYILRYSWPQQILLTAMSALSLPFLYMFYDTPKMIINQAVGGQPGDFPRVIFGVEFGQIGYLFLLCGAFLILVIINQCFKYFINVYKGLTGERMLRRLRYELYGRVLRFPLPTFRKMSQGEIIPMVTAEVEPLGGFAGDSISLPAFQGGYLVTILLFLFIQDWRMASAAVMLYPLQVWLIPKLQRKVNLLGKERVRRVRRLSDRIGETVQGVQEIHVHDGARYALTEFATQLNGIFDVRYQIYVKKFIIKFVNNFIQQLGPFFFYSIGGYFVIQGEIEIGTLVAAIAAHKDLAGPWKELLRYYQMSADAMIKYDQVISQFGPAGMRDESYQLDEPENAERLQGELAAANLTLHDDQEVAVVDGVSFRLPLDQRTAIVGAAGSGKEELTLLISRLLDAERGNLTIAGSDVASMPEAVTGRRMSFVGEGSFIFAGTIADNLVFGLKNRPMIERTYEGPAEVARRRYMSEARRSGNIDYDIEAEWVDYAAAGAADLAELRHRALSALELVSMSDDVYQFGLRGTIDPNEHDDMAAAILGARGRLRERLSDPELAPLVESFDRDRYNSNASVAENLLFGNPVGDEFDIDRLAENAYVLEVLDKVGLSERMLQVGYQVAATTVELFADLPPDHELFQQFSFISADDLPEAQALLQRADKANLAALNDEDRNRLMSLPFMLIPARHRLGLIDDDFRAAILQAREVFATDLPDALRDAVAFFEAEKYNAAANLQDNILFGKVAYGQAQAPERVGALIREVIDELELRHLVSEVGLNFHVGIAGSRLSGSLRQKVALARAVLKRPDLLILFEATASLDAASQSKVMENVLTEFEGRGLIWSVHRTEMAEKFDSVLVMRQGRVIEQGTFDELRKDGTYFSELLAAG